MKKIKRIICAALATVIIGNIICATTASAYYSNRLTAGDSSSDRGYVDEGGLTVDGVLSRMRKIGIVQGITYYSAITLATVDDGEYTYQDWIDLRGDGSDTDGDGDSGVFSSDTDEDYIMSGMYIEKALTGSAEDGRFKRQNTNGYLIENLARVLDVRQFDRYKDKYNDDLDGDYVYRLLCGEDVYNPATDEMVHEDGLVRDPDDGSCTRNSRRLEWRGQSDVDNILIERFNYVAYNYGWTEIETKISIHDEGERSSMGYFGEVAGYGMYLAETGIGEGAITNEGCIAGTNASDGIAKEVYLFDSEANSGKMTKVTRYIYGGAPGNKDKKDYTSFVGELHVNGNYYDSYRPGHSGVKGWLYDTFTGDGEVTGEITCSLMIDRMNEIAETMKVGNGSYGNGLLDHTYKFLLNRTCLKSFEDQKDTAAAALNDPNTPEEDKELNENIVREYTDLAKDRTDRGYFESDDSSYQWIESAKDEDNHESYDSHGWSEYGYQCIETDYLQSPNQVNKDLDLAESTASTEESCYSAGGALTWIICPLITTMASATQTIYENFIEPYLVIDSSYFLVQVRNSNAPQRITSPSNVVVKIWDYFRTISNIFLVIVMTVIIISQVTGFGIDNYGIKKMLPKVIVTAILVNFSYYICLLAIDVANIMGVVLKNLMETIGNMVQINIQLTETTGEKVTTLAIAGVLTVVIGYITYNTVLSYGIGLLIPIVAGLVSAVIGVFVLFAVLALRIMIIWMGVAFSGIAIASYMLPNTKKLYDLWFGLMWKALLCYPICSIVVYGGQLMGKIALTVTFANADSKLGQVGAMLVSLFLTVGPLIILPTIIKSSFSMARGMVAAMDRTRMRLQAGARHHINHNPTAMAIRRRGMENGILRRNHMSYDKKTGQVKDSRFMVRHAQNILDDPTADASKKAWASNYLKNIAKKDAGRDAFFGSTAGVAANIITGRRAESTGQYGLGIEQANNQLNAASVKNKRERYAGAEFGYGNVSQLRSELERRLTSGDNSIANATDMTAIAGELASTKEGKKALAEVISAKTKDNSFDTSAIDSIVKIASKADPSIMQALTDEEMPIAQYLQDRLQGKKSASKNYDEWLTTAADDAQIGNPDATTNFQKVMTVIAKNPAEIAKQGDEILNRLSAPGSDPAEERLRAAAMGTSDGHGVWTSTNPEFASDQEKVRASLATAIASKSSWDGKEVKRTKVLKRWAADASAKECSDMLRRRGADFSAEQRQILLDKIKAESGATQTEAIRRDAASAARSILNDPYSGLDDQELESMRDVVAASPDATVAEREYKTGGGRYTATQRQTMAGSIIQNAVSAADATEARRILGDRALKFDAAQRQQLIDHVIAKEGGTLAGAQAIVADFGSELSDVQRQNLGAGMIGSISTAADASAVVSSGEFALTEPQLDSLINMFASDANLAKSTLMSSGSAKLNQAQRDRLLQGVVSQISTVGEASAILTNNNLGIDGAFKQTVANVALSGATSAEDISTQARLIANADLSGVDPSKISSAIANIASSGTAQDASTVLSGGTRLDASQQQALMGKLFAGNGAQEVATQASFIKSGGMGKVDESLIAGQMQRFAQNASTGEIWDVLMKTDFSKNISLQAQQTELAKKVIKSYAGDAQALTAIGQTFMSANGGQVRRVGSGASGSYATAQEMMNDVIAKANTDARASELLGRIASEYVKSLRP